MKNRILTILFGALVVAAFSYRTEFIHAALYLEKLGTAHPAMAGILLIFLKTISAPLGFPGTPLTLVTGSLFGTALGTLIALIGNTLGAGLAFLVVKYLAKEYVQKNIISRYQHIQAYEEVLNKKAFQAVVILRLIPLFPFNALNFILGCTNIPFKTYLLGSFIGMIPGTLLFVYFGESLRMLSPINILLALIGILGLTYFGKHYGNR